MKVNSQDLLYPPPNSDHIFWMYPWQSFARDMLELCLNMLIKPLSGRNIFNEIKVTEELSNYFPDNATVYTDSGRSAILLTLQSLGISQGDEVILSTFNCPTVIDPIIMSGATPVLVDCDKNCRIDPIKTKQAITNKTKAIIITNIYGILDNENSIRSLVIDNPITIINDLSQTLIVPRVNPDYFKHDEIYIFSFGPEKQLCCFGGGAIYCLNNSIGVIRKLHRESQTTNKYSLFKVGISRIKYFFTLLIYARMKSFVPLFSKFNLVSTFSDSKSLTEPSSPEKIVIKQFHPIQKSILLRKLKNYQRNLIRNNANFLQLQNSVKHNCNKLRFIKGDYINPIYLTLVIDASRIEIAKKLSSMGIPTVWNYIPLHLFSRYNKFNKQDYKIANQIWKQVLSLPFRYPMIQRQISQVSSSLRHLC